MMRRFCSRCLDDVCSNLAEALALKNGSNRESVARSMKVMEHEWVGKTGCGLVGHHWQDKNAMTSILWLYFCVLGVSAISTIRGHRALAISVGLSFLPVNESANRYARGMDWLANAEALEHEAPIQVAHRSLSWLSAWHLP